VKRTTMFYFYGVKTRAAQFRCEWLAALRQLKGRN
jgi:hypothetical protein